MLKVETPEGVIEIVDKHFPSNKRMGSFNDEEISIISASGRVLAQDIVSAEDLPAFNRSTVDGYAVLASDTFGCSESIPAVLTLTGEVLTGSKAAEPVLPGTTVIVSTGGEIPPGADAVVMHEFTEDYGNGVIGINKPAAPGNNVIFKGDDVSGGQTILKAGKKLAPHDIGVLSALGFDKIDVRVKPVVGIISTGDELVPVTEKPAHGQIRDINTPMLLTATEKYGAKAENYGIIKDDENAIRTAVISAVKSCDIILISGGSSAGTHDLTARIIESEGEILFHGIAMKPGKPTIFGIVNGKPVFGLPGNPVAAYIVTELFVRHLIANLTGTELKRKTTKAIITEAISSNTGRADYIPVSLKNDSTGTMTARPVISKSGLITSLTEADGYINIKRDSEGIAKDTEVTVIYF